MSRPGRLWWQLRRDLGRGWGATRQHYFTLPRIEEWSWPFWGEKPQEIPVHVLTGADDWRLAAWTLASWFHFSENAWPVVIHDDGTLPNDARASLEVLFPKARFILRKEADATMEPVLKAFPFCYEYRGMHPRALRIFDVPHFTTSERFILFDSTLLFFSFPREILDWVNAKNNECWFNEDAEERSLLSAHEAQAELNVKLWSRVNSGLGLIHKSAIDLDFCDKALAETSILRGKIERIEQTLYALCASRHGKGGLLPKRYEVSSGKHSAGNAVSRNYVGAARERFYGEGLKRLAPVLLAKG